MSSKDSNNHANPQNGRCSNNHSVRKAKDDCKGPGTPLEKSAEKQAYSFAAQFSENNYDFAPNCAQSTTQRFPAATHTAYSVHSTTSPLFLRDDSDKSPVRKSQQRQARKASSNSVEGQVTPSHLLQTPPQSPPIRATRSESGARTPSSNFTTRGYHLDSSIKEFDRMVLGLTLNAGAQRGFAMGLKRTHSVESMTTPLSLVPPHQQHPPQLYPQSISPPSLFLRDDSDKSFVGKSQQSQLRNSSSQLIQSGHSSPVPNSPKLARPAPHVPVPISQRMPSIERAGSEGPKRSHSFSSGSGGSVGSRSPLGFW